MANFVYALIAVILVSLASFTGALALFLRKEFLEKAIMVLVAFGAGALIGGALLHLMPEAIEAGGPVFPMFIIGLLLFFVIETYLYWYHCHAGHIHKHKRKHKCPIKPMGILNLIGDGIHNFTDGIIVASAFIVNIPLGIATTIGVVLHEIPQELGDFGVLIHSGFSRGRALFFNFLSALAAILGVIATYIFASLIDNLTLYLIPFAAGGFMYIATVDLMSELKEEENVRKATWQVLIFLLGIFIMWLLKFMHGH